MVRAPNVTANTRIQSCHRDSGRRKVTHISVSLAETFYPLRHIVCDAVSRIWLRESRLSFGRQVNVNLDQIEPSLFQFRVRR
jgi:hypothetical protein